MFCLSVLFIENILKEILDIDISEMTLFNYKKCECCKRQQNNINVEFEKLLPSNICSQITEYNIYCD